jgi:thiamine biosynthesis lipoprotein
MNADALSTTVFVLGYEKGRALIESLEGTDAIFVFDDKSVRKTGTVDFTLTNESYRLLPD